MRLEKDDKSYDEYKLTVSFLQLKAIASCLTKNGTDATTDELRRGIEYHLDREPKPGQTKEDLKAKEEADEEAAERGNEIGFNDAKFDKEMETDDKEYSLDEIPDPDELDDAPEITSPDASEEPEDSEEPPPPPRRNKP